MDDAALAETGLALPEMFYGQGNLHNDMDMMSIVRLLWDFWADDAVISPDGQLLLVVAGDQEPSLQIFSMLHDAQRVVEILGEFPLYSDERIVSVYWAEGEQLNTWIALLQDYDGW